MTDRFAETRLPDTHEPIYVPHAEFRNGLPVGRFRVIINPDRARAYIKRKLLLTFVLLPVIAGGAALALLSYAWPGLILILLGIAAHRIVIKQAPKILLSLAFKDEKVYDEAINLEILEVRLP